MVQIDKEEEIYIWIISAWLPAQKLLFRNHLNQRFNMQTDIRSEDTMIKECRVYFNMHSCQNIQFT